MEMEKKMNHKTQSSRSNSNSLSESLLALSNLARVQSPTLVLPALRALVESLDKTGNSSGTTNSSSYNPENLPSNVDRVCRAVGALAFFSSPDSGLNLSLPEDQHYFYDFVEPHFYSFARYAAAVARLEDDNKNPDVEAARTYIIRRLGAVVKRFRDSLDSNEFVMGLALGHDAKTLKSKPFALGDKKFQTYEEIVDYFAPEMTLANGGFVWDSWIQEADKAKAKLKAQGRKVSQEEEEDRGNR